MSIFCRLHAWIQKIRHGDPENCFGHRRILQRAVRASLEKQLAPTGQIASRGGSVLVFLRKHITTWDFPGGGGGQTRCPLSGSAHVLCIPLSHVPHAHI